MQMVDDHSSEMTPQQRADHAHMLYNHQDVQQMAKDDRFNTQTAQSTVLHSQCAMLNNVQSSKCATDNRI